MKDLRATWFGALKAFFLPLIMVFVFRWLLIEPYVIPSGSMIPTLLVHDHIFVNKLSYGIHWPDSSRWLVQWNVPKVGEIAVFRYPVNPKIFFVKRIVAVAGDEIEVRNGILSRNGVELDQVEVASPSFMSDSDFTYFLEEKHWVRYQNRQASQFQKLKVPEGHFFVMGDNRDSSSDSRFWGSVPFENLIGRAALVWMSCEETLPTAKFMCDPQTMRWNRMMKWVDSLNPAGFNYK